MSLKGGGKSAAEMNEEWLGGMTMNFSCTFCSWNFEGGLVEGRSKAQEHRASVHPEIPPFRRRKRVRGATPMRPTWRANLSEEEREEVEAERHRRAVLLGIEIET